MKENIIYLFLSGLVLGSGPCLGFCAPLLAAYTAARKSSVKNSLISYAVFAGFRMLSYCILGFILALGIKALNRPSLAEYTQYIYPALGFFIIIIGLTVIFAGARVPAACSWLHKGHVRNVGILGLLTGLTPCLPLLGIFNYVLIIADTPLMAVFHVFIFGLGTAISPLMLAMALSAKLSQIIAGNRKFHIILRAACGLILVYLGARSILRTLLP